VFVALGIILISAAAWLFIFSKRAQPVSTPQQTQSEHFRRDGMLKIMGPDGTVKQTLDIEIVQREDEQMQGMMGRTYMAQNHAMLFVYDIDEERSFWMANTPLPLDIIYINGSNEIIRIHSRTTPYSEQSYESGKPARFVLETNGGYCDRNGVTEGDKIEWKRY
jgi:uncharacterized membrane protein (UPF0127 family)